MKVKREDLLICTSNDGGYRGGYCAVCGKRGNLNCNPPLEHAEGCPVADEGTEYLHVGYEA